MIYPSTVLLSIPSVALTCTLLAVQLITSIMQSFWQNNIHICIIYTWHKIQCFFFIIIMKLVDIYIRWRSCVSTLNLSRINTYIIQYFMYRSIPFHCFKVLLQNYSRLISLNDFHLPQLPNAFLSRNLLNMLFSARCLRYW